MTIDTPQQRDAGSLRGRWRATDPESLERQRAYRRAYLREYRLRRGRPQQTESNPVDRERHRESVIRWLERHGYTIGGMLPGEVMELVRSAGLEAK